MDSECDREIHHGWSEPEEDAAVIPPPPHEDDDVGVVDGKCVYFRVFNSYDVGFPIHWYRFSIEKGSEGDDLEHPNRLKLYSRVNQSTLSAVLAVDSSIYCIGGEDFDCPYPSPYGNKVYRLDTATGSTPESRKWELCPPMNQPRCLPRSVFFDGKIYVVGGLQNPTAEIWAERFDICTKTWELLPKSLYETLNPAGVEVDPDLEEPVLEFSVALVTDDGSSRRILFSSNRCKPHFYNPDHHSLTPALGYTYSLHPLGPSDRTPPVVHRNTQYTVLWRDGVVLSYRLDNGDYKVSRDRFPEGIIYRSYEPRITCALLRSDALASYLDGDKAQLHFIWYGNPTGHSICQDEQEVYYRSVSYSEEVEEPGQDPDPTVATRLRGCINSTKLFGMPSRSSIIDGLVLEPSRGRKRKEGE